MMIMKITFPKNRKQTIPEGFAIPPLHPTGAELETKQLGEGVYALVSTKAPVDNSGFVIGERGVLVIDAHISKEMAQKIQKAIRQITDKPILYLVNTNFHGDHTFGNYAFPRETQIVAHFKTAEKMREFDYEKQFMLNTVNGDQSIFGDAKLRLPNIVFDNHLKLDLGGRFVELHHFGRGNTEGDTVVYIPEEKVAWTGNLVLGEGSVPFLIEGGAGDYLDTIARFAKTIETKTIVPGHGSLTTGAILGRYLNYLNDLLQSVRNSVLEHQTLKETLTNLPLGKYAPQQTDAKRDIFASFLPDVHGWDVRITYQEITQNQSGKKK